MSARLLYMVCYKTNPDSYQTYWDVYPAGSAEEATELARQDGLFKVGIIHRWTVPYNREGMTPEETYAAYEKEKA